MYIIISFHDWMLRLNEYEAFSLIKTKYYKHNYFIRVPYFENNVSSIEC